MAATSLRKDSSHVRAAHLSLMVALDPVEIKGHRFVPSQVDSSAPQTTCSLCKKAVTETDNAFRCSSQQCGIGLVHLPCLNKKSRQKRLKHCKGTLFVTGAPASDRDSSPKPHRKASPWGIGKRSKKKESSTTPRRSSGLAASAGGGAEQHLTPEHLTPERMSGHSASAANAKKKFLPICRSRSFGELRMEAAKQTDPSELHLRAESAISLQLGLQEALKFIEARVESAFEKNATVREETKAFKEELSAQWSIAESLVQARLKRDLDREELLSHLKACFERTRACIETLKESDFLRLAECYEELVPSTLKKTFRLLNEVSGERTGEKKMVIQEEDAAEHCKSMQFVLETLQGILKLDKFLSIEEDKKKDSSMQALKELNSALVKKDKEETGVLLQLQENGHLLEVCNQALGGLLDVIKRKLLITSEENEAELREVTEKARGTPSRQGSASPALSPVSSPASSPATSPAQAPASPGDEDEADDEYDEEFDADVDLDQPALEVASPRGTYRKASLSMDLDPLELQAVELAEASDARDRDRLPDLEPVSDVLSSSSTGSLTNRHPGSSQHDSATESRDTLSDSDNEQTVFDHYDDDDANYSMMDASRRNAVSTLGQEILGTIASCVSHVTAGVEEPLLLTRPTDTEPIDQNITTSKKGISVDDLIELLVDVRSRNITTLSSTFLRCYRYFMSTEELLQRIVMRFCCAPRLTDKEMQARKDSQNGVRLRVLVFLKYWISKFWEQDFAGVDSKPYQLVLSFLENTVMHTSCHATATQLIKMVHDRAEGSSCADGSEAASTPSPGRPKPPPAGPCYERLGLLDMPSRVLAEQITLYEFGIYKRLKPSELMNKQWSSKKSAQLAPNITKITAHFNAMGNWIVMQVLAYDNVRERATALKRAINVCQHLYIMNNFNAAIECVAGLTNSAILRLRQTWQVAGLDTFLRMTKMCKLLDNNFALYRRELAMAELPVLPYVGMFLTDLTFLEDGNPNLVDGKINFRFKFSKISATIDSVLHYQASEYNFTPLPAIQEQLAEVTSAPLRSDEAYPVSLLLESKADNAPVPQFNASSLPTGVDALHEQLRALRVDPSQVDDHEAGPMETQKTRLVAALAPLG